MNTPRKLGKLAQQAGISAPSLDDNLMRLVKNVSINTEERKRHFVEWWGGWYEGLDASISQPYVDFTKKSSVA